MLQSASWPLVRSPPRQLSGSGCIIAATEWVHNYTDRFVQSQRPGHLTQAPLPACPQIYLSIQKPASGVHSGCTRDYIVQLSYDAGKGKLSNFRDPVLIAENAAVSAVSAEI